MSKQLYTFRCEFCGHTQKVVDKDARVWCPHTNRYPQQKPELMQRVEEEAA